MGAWSPPPGPGAPNDVGRPRPLAVVVVVGLVVFVVGAVVVWAATRPPPEPTLMELVDADGTDELHHRLDDDAGLFSTDEFDNAVEYAIEVDDLAALQVMVGGDDADFEYGDLASYLYYAIDAQYHAALGAMLDVGVDPESGNALHEAARADDLTAALLLLRAGADPGRRSADGDLPADLAHECSTLDAIYRTGGDITAARVYAEPLLAIATRCGSAPVEPLLQLGADPNATLGYGETALFWAALDPTSATVRALLAAGADPNAAAQLDSGAAFALAEKLGDQPLTREQLDALLTIAGLTESLRDMVATSLPATGGSWADVADPFLSGFVDIGMGWYTPLFTAALAGNAETVQMLLEAGALATAPNGTGTATAATVARIMGHTEIAASIEAHAGFGVQVAP